MDIRWEKSQHLCVDPFAPPGLIQIAKEMNSEGSLSVENISTNIQIPRLLCVTVWRRRKIFLTKLFSPRSSGWRCHKKNMLIYLLHKELLTCHIFFPGREGLNLTLHNVLFVQYIFPRNGTSSDLSQNLSFGIPLNIYLSQLVRMCGKYIFSHFCNFQT